MTGSRGATGRGTTHRQEDRAANPSDPSQGQSRLSHTRPSLSRVKQMAGLGSWETGGAGVGEAEVDVRRAVPGDGFVGADGVVLGPVGLGVFDEVQGVVDLFEEQPFVLQGAEAAFA